MGANGWILGIWRCYIDGYMGCGYVGVTSCLNPYPYTTILNTILLFTIYIHITNTKQSVYELNLVAAGMRKKKFVGLLEVEVYAVGVYVSRYV